MIRFEDIKQWCGGDEGKKTKDAECEVTEVGSGQARLLACFDSQLCKIT